MIHIALIAICVVIYVFYKKNHTQNNNASGHLEAKKLPRILWDLFFQLLKLSITAAKWAFGQYIALKKQAEETAAAEKLAAEKLAAKQTKKKNSSRKAEDCAPEHYYNTSDDYYETSAREVHIYVHHEEVPKKGPSFAERLMR